MNPPLALFIAYCLTSILMSLLLGACFYNMGDQS